MVTLLPERICKAGGRGEPTISTRSQRVNEEIHLRELRLIDEEGQQIGIVSASEALAIARERDLDLVEVAPNAEPPVCRLMNYGKYLYERAKKEREARKAQKSTEIKEIRLRPKTGEHDIAFKLRDARRFLADGAKVKFRVRFRGREVTHPELARELLLRVASELEDVGTVEQQPTMEGPNLLMVVVPMK